jgi:hypothetical protein
MFRQSIFLSSIYKIDFDFPALFYLIPTMMKFTQHATERCKERCIDKKKLDINYVKTLPIYTRENGCIKYLDLKHILVYYVRGNRIVTMIAPRDTRGNPDPLKMLRYYAFGQGIDFNKYCRDYAFDNCKRGSKCKYIHVN